MPKLVEKQRKSMPKDVFAFVDKRGVGHLPLNDEAHVRNAMARWNQTGFESLTAKESARREIRAAARRRGIEVSPTDKIAHPATGLRVASTRTGPRGGRVATTPKRPTTTRQRVAARRNIKRAQAARRAS